VPQDFETALKEYGHAGYRVIAIAMRSIEDRSDVDFQILRRESVERDLIFLGFVVFENRLKRKFFMISWLAGFLPQALIWGFFFLTSIFFNF
jgi:hypothetical protein